MTGPQLDLMEGRRRRDREIEGHRERKSALLQEIDARRKYRRRCHRCGAHEQRIEKDRPHPNKVGRP